MDFKSIIEGFAKIGLPILGAALPVPGGMAIGTAIASMIGSDSAKPEDILATLTQDATAREKALEFQINHEETLVKLKAEHDMREYEAEVADRASARSMQSTTQSKVLPMLAFLAVGGFIITTVVTLGGWAKVDSALAGTLIGYMSAKSDTVFSFFFGSSHSSREKDATIAAQAQVAQVAKSA